VSAPINVLEIKSICFNKYQKTEELDEKHSVCVKKMKSRGYVAVSLSLVILSILFVDLSTLNSQSYSFLAAEQQYVPAAGWLNGWQYRKMHNILGAAGAGTNYQIKITTYYNNRLDASNAASPSISNGGYLAEDIVYDPVTALYWWIFEDRSSSSTVIRMAYASSINGSWTVETTPVISNAYSPFIAKFGDYWYIYYNYGGNIWAQKSSSVNTGYNGLGISNPILSKGSGSEWDNNRVDEPYVFLEGSTYYLFYMGEDISNLYEKTGYATSSSPTSGFVKYFGNPVLPTGNHGWDGGQDKAADPFVFKYGNVFYIGVSATASGKGNWVIGFYETIDFVTFVHYGFNPVLGHSSSGGWDANAVLRGAVSNFNGIFHFAYGGFDGTSFRCGKTILKITSSDSGGDVFLNGLCRSDFGDIRFTGNDGVTPLDYWLESETDSTSAVFWVKIADDISVGNSAIYVYYGKSDATTTSNGPNTFLFFDDFSGTLDKWIVIHGAWSVSGGTLTIEPPAGQSNWNNYVVTANPVATNAIAIRAKLKSEQAGDSQAHPGLCWHANSLTGTNQRNDHVFFRPHHYSETSWPNIQPAYCDGNLNWFSGKYGSYFNWNIWNTIELRIPSSGNVKLYCSDSYWYDWGNQQYSYDRVGCAAHEQGKSYWDYFLVRKYIDPEPSHGVWGSEESTPTKSNHWQFTFDFLDLDNNSLNSRVTWQLYNGSQRLNYQPGQFNLLDGTYALRTMIDSYQINMRSLNAATCGNSTIPIHLQVKQQLSAPNGYIALNSSILSIVVHSQTSTNLTFTISGSPGKLLVRVPHNSEYLKKDQLYMQTWTWDYTRKVILIDSSNSTYEFNFLDVPP
jgi:hypothetical protein